MWQVWSSGALMLSAILSVVLSIWSHLRFRSRWKATSDGERARRHAAWWARLRGVGLAGIGASVAGLAFVWADKGAAWGLLPVVVLLAWGARGFFEDLVAGWIVMARVPFGRGDLVEAAGRRGIVTRAGLTALRLRGFDHVEHDVPYWRLLREGVSRLSVAATEVPVEVDLPWLPSLPPIEARSYAAICAASSPFASLHARPETFLVADPVDGSRIRVRVRGYVFDAAYAEAFRSHVLEAWMERAAAAN
jgi:hypothetical protein